MSTVHSELGGHVLVLYLVWLLCSPMQMNIPPSLLQHNLPLGTDTHISTYANTNIHTKGRYCLKLCVCQCLAPFWLNSEGNHELLDSPTLPGLSAMWVEALDNIASIFTREQWFFEWITVFFSYFLLFRWACFFPKTIEMRAFLMNDWTFPSLSPFIRSARHHSDLFPRSSQVAWWVGEVILPDLRLQTHWLRHWLDPAASRQSYAVDGDHMGWGIHRLWFLLQESLHHLQRQQQRAVLRHQQPAGWGHSCVLLCTEGTV